MHICVCAEFITSVWSAEIKAEETVFPEKIHNLSNLQDNLQSSLQDCKKKHFLSLHQLLRLEETTQFLRQAESSLV